MKKLFCLLFVALLLGSCSSVRPIHSQDKKQIGKLPDHVDMPLEPGATEKPVEVVPPEETVRVGDRGGDVYVNNQAEEHGPVQNRKLKIALALGPGIFRTINYVSVLKVLERQNLAPDIITGTGFGAIVAAMYATGMTPEVIEWNFYKYFKEKRKNRPYDSDWVNEIDEVFLQKFKSLNLGDTKKKFFITLYDHTTKKTYYFDKGNIRDLLLLNLRLSSNTAETKKGQKFSTPIEKEVFNARLLRQLGAEFTMCIDTLGSKFEFVNANEFLVGVYARTAGKIQRERKEFDYSITLPLQGMGLDSSKDSALFLQKTYEFMLKQSPIISKKIQAKIEGLSHSGNE